MRNKYILKFILAFLLFSGGLKPVYSGAWHHMSCHGVCETCSKQPPNQRQECMKLGRDVMGVGVSCNCGISCRELCLLQSKELGECLQKCYKYIELDRF